jgi:protein ImuB
MARIACLDLPALPLQLAERSHPEWRGRPVVVVDRDHPRGIVKWANERARRVGILPGLHYAAGLSLDADLRAATVPREDIVAAQSAIVTLLLTLSPAVEASPHEAEPEIFWLDADGLGLLHASLEVWGHAVRRKLAEDRFSSALSVGYGRFGSYATVRALCGRGQVIWAREADEQLAVRRVPLARVVLDTRARDALAKLGVTTVGQLATLPEAGLLRRFGAEVHRLHQRAIGARKEPLTPSQPVSPPRGTLDFDDPILDREALLFLGKQLLDPLLHELARRGQALAELRIELALENGNAALEEIVRPALPTLDAPQLLNLLRLRLERVELAAAVRSLTLVAAGQPATREQLTLFAEAVAKKRDRAAGDRALARVRAAFGDAAVVRAKLRSGHLPEASYSWEPIDKLTEPHPPIMLGLDPPLVRRLRTRALALPARPTREPDGWLLRGIPHGPVARLTGPFHLSGGWWRAVVHRDYYYAELARGALHLIYYDRRRRSWFLQGEVS